MEAKAEPLLPSRLFWDIKDHKPDYAVHPEWVINRVFGQGSLEDIADIIIYYGADKVKDVLTRTPHMDEDLMYLASAIFATPLNTFLCYSTNQYRKIF